MGELEQDMLLALGIVPVATTEWLGDPPPPGAIHPWAQDALGGAEPPEALKNFDGVQFERIGRAAPGSHPGALSFIEQSDYDKLAKVAPTVAQPKEFVNYGAPWQLMARTIGRAVGQPERAEQVVTGVEARISQARAAHPEFAGASALVALPGEDGSYVTWPWPSTTAQFLAGLGFQTPAQITELAGGEQYLEISGERLELLAADVLLWLYVDDDSQREIRANPLYAGLDVATQGRDVFLVGGSDVLTDALTYSTVLSIPFALDRLLPMLAAAIDGDPATR